MATMTTVHDVPAGTSWRSDASIAYAILRLTLGVNIGLRGAVRIAHGSAVFAQGIVKQMEPTILPPSAVHAFAMTLVWVETAVGLLLILGLQTRLALIVGGLMMTLLTFGTMQVENFQNAWLQLTYALVFFVVLALRSWNRISLDAMMKSSKVVLVAVAVAGVFAASPSFAGQRARASAAAKPAATPRTADGKVDFSGMWSPDRNFIYDIHDTLEKGAELPLQPWAEKVARERPSKDDPEANCLPTGVPRQAPYPWRIVQTPTHMFFLFEGNIHSYRQIFLDGRKHPDDPDPTWYGHSVARWDGETLVVDSVGFNDKFWFDFAGHPHTEKLHVIERYRRPDFDHLDYDITIDDPGTFTKTFVMHGHSAYQHNDELMEYICNENNKDVSHIVGKDPRNKYAK